MSVAELALQYQTGVKEIVALCQLLGIRALSGETVLSEKDVARVRDVLEGRAPFPTVQVTSRRGGGGPSIGVILGIVAAVALVVLIGVGANAVLSRDATIRVEPGQCFNDPGSFGVRLTAVSCSGPHDYKAFAKIDLDETFDEFPGQQKIIEHAEERCLALSGATDYVEVYYFGPADEITWRDEDTHAIVCAYKE